MKTTLDIPDPLYRQAKLLAFERGVSLKEVMIRGLEREILGPAVEPGAPLLTREEQSTYSVDPLGFVVLKRPATRKPVVTDKLVDRLRDQEGV